MAEYDDEITDPKELAQLMSGDANSASGIGETQYDDEITDPKELSQLMSQAGEADESAVAGEKKVKKENPDEDSGFFGTTRNIAAGGLQGFNQTFEPIAKALSPLKEFAHPQMPTSKPGELYNRAIYSLIHQNPKTPQQITFDPYKLMGTTKADTLLSRKGIEQAAGEHGPALVSAGKLIKGGADWLFSQAPKKLAQSLADIRMEQIKNVASTVKSNMSNAYKEVMGTQGNLRVTQGDPEKFLNLSEETLSRLGEKAQKAYDLYVKDPIFKHLHEFQSALGERATTLFHRPDTFTVAEKMRAEARAAKEKALDFLRPNDRAYYAYKYASDTKRDLDAAFDATPELKKIARGNVATGDRTHDALFKILQDATEQGTVIPESATSAKKVLNGVPIEHPLQDIFEQMRTDKEAIEKRKTLYKLGKWGAGVTGTGAVAYGLPAIGIDATNFKSLAHYLGKKTKERFG